MDHKERRILIKKIINDQRVRTQEQLLTLLKENGVAATQATISRDLRALSIAKVNDGEGRPYYSQLTEVEAPQIDRRLDETIQNTVVSIVTVQFMNVIKTIPNSNYATILAGLFDDSGMSEIVGTLAGNDTLIVISPTADQAKQVYQLVIDQLNQPAK